jgi:hypothetical protein
MCIDMENQENIEEVSSVVFAKETRDSAKLGQPSSFIKFQKGVLVFFAILFAGLMQLIIFLLFN